MKVVDSTLGNDELQLQKNYSCTHDLTLQVPHGNRSENLQGQRLT